MDVAEAWAEELLESTGELDQVPESLLHYIDVAAYTKNRPSIAGAGAAPFGRCAGTWS